MKISQKNKVLSFILVVVMVLTAVPISYIMADAEASISVVILHNGEKTTGIVLQEDGEETIIADVAAEGVSYRWQILTDEEDDTWVTFTDRSHKECKVNLALIKSNLNKNGTAYLRCVVREGDKQYKSEPFAVTVSFKVPQEAGTTDIGSASNVTVSKENGTQSVIQQPKLKAKARAAAIAETTTYNVVVKYVFSDNNEIPAWEPERFNVQASSALTDYAITLPVVIGYEAEYDSTNQPNGGELDISRGVFMLNIDSVNNDMEFVITYSPKLTPYKIIHHLQNLDTEGYDQTITEEKQGLTGTLLTGDLHKTGENPAAANYDERFKGFSYLTYRHLVIAADGQTEVHIYYNRNYYVVEYKYVDEYDESYEIIKGVESIAVRYGTEIVSREPTRAGYNFSKWLLVGCGSPTEDANTNNPEYSRPTAEQLDTFDLTAKGRITVPNYNIKFIPLWTNDATSFTVVYWREAESKAGSEEEIKYEYWGSKAYGYDEIGDAGDIVYNDTVITGKTVKPTDNIPGSTTLTYKEVPEEIRNIKGTNIDETNFLEYNSEASDDSKVVEGDGSTVLNIFYDRKEYTLKFYYAAQSGNNYYVIGRTNPFGSEASGSNKNDEINLFDAAWNSNSWFYPFVKTEVNALPEIINPNKENNTGKKYDTGTDTSKNSTNRKYHYFSFKAKYGADISDYWPGTNDITAVQKTDNDYVVFSAWNGESNVYYTRHRDLFGDNETIKGQYRRLDYRALWDTSLAATSNDTTYNNTVTYLAYWCNTQSWNVPSLYRYNIYLECLNTHTSGTCDDCEDKNPKTFTTSDGVTKTYYCVAVYDVADNNDTTGNVNLQQQTHPDVYGFTNVNHLNDTDANIVFTQGVEYQTMTAGTGADNYDSSVYRSGYEIYHFYDRTRYNLKFNNNGEYLQNVDANNNFTDNLTIRYGVKIGNAATYDLNKAVGPDGESYYPNNLQEDGYEFTGWYTSPTFAEGTEFKFTATDTMPAHDMELYARWEKKKHTVWVYANKEDAQAGMDGDISKAIYKKPPEVTHGDYSPTPSDPKPLDNGDAFAGWYYLNESNEETRFIFSSQTILHDMHIYAKYESNVAVDYTIHFYAAKYNSSGEPELISDEKGNPVKVAEDRTAWAVAKTNVTVYAKTGEELFPDYREHWFATHITQDLELTVDGKNEKIVYYVQKEIVPYRVEYVYEDGTPVKGTTVTTENGVIAITKDDSCEAIVAPHPDNRFAVVTETAPQLEGYLPDSLQKRLVLTASPDQKEGEVLPQNVLQFVYKVAPANTTLVQVIEYTESLVEDNYVEFTNTLYSKTLSDGDYKYTVKNLSGFEFAAAKTKFNGVVATNPSVVGDVITHDLVSGGLLIEVYYDRLMVEYTVRHELHDTNNTFVRLLPDSPTNPTTGKGMHGASIAKSANNYPGYTLAPDSAFTKQLTLNATAPANNTITFIYYEDMAEIKYAVVIDGKEYDYNWLSVHSAKAMAHDETVDKPSKPLDMERTVQDGVTYKFDSWYLNKECTLPVDSTWVDDVNQLTPQQTGEIFTDATYYAKFVPAQADLIIKTEFLTSQGVYSKIDPNKTFIFMVKGIDSDLLMTITIHGKGTATIEDLPVGQYEVTYLSDWNWRYGLNNQNDYKSVITITGSDVTKTYVPVRNSGKWLDADNYNENIFQKIFSQS